MDQVKVIYQNGMLEELNIETVIISPTNSSIGINVMSTFIDNEYVLHIFSLDKDGDSYDVIRELASFTFPFREVIERFCCKLPLMSVIDY